MRLPLLVTALLPAVAATVLPLSPAAAADPVVLRDTEQVCPPGGVPEDGFGDVGQGTTHEAAVDCVVWWQIARGVNGQEYRPESGVNRGAMATFIAGTIESAGGALPATPPDSFHDDDGGTHELRTNQLAAVGIVAGTGGGSYSPAATVTRGQMAKFIALSAKYLAERDLESGGDRFSDDNGTTFESYINQIAQAGVTGGSSDGTYRAAATVTRDQMGSFVARDLDLLVEEGYPEGAAALRTSPFTGGSIDPACPRDRIQSAGYNDTAGDPYREAIDCAAHWGVVRGTRADVFSPRTLVSREQAATYAVRLFQEIGGSRPDSVPDAYVDDEGSVHEDSINVLAAIGASPVPENRWFMPQSRLTAAELVGFLNGVYAARSGGKQPFAVTPKDRPVLRAELAAEMDAYLSVGVQDGYATVP